MKWPYADLSWWSDAVTDATKTEVDQLGGSVALRRNPSCDPLLDCKEMYSERLAFLANEDGLTKSEAQSFLFYAKALKKWRLAPADLARTRRIEALNGFEARNGAINEAYVPPEPYREQMARILKSWLAGPSSGMGCHGRFGPGACAEKWHHVQRFCKLWDWCQTSNADSDWVYPRGSSDVDHVTARLCAVPKDWYRDRLITVEPAYNTYVQQHGRSLILSAIHSGPLRGSVMDLGYTDGPSMQRKLAVKASKDGGMATIDLKDASDSVSWEAVQAVFPAWVVDLCWATRSPMFTRNERNANPQPLKMFGGMGNAMTFVIETLFFSAYVKAFAWAHGLRLGSSQSGRGVTTFGDDVICPTDVAEALVAEGGNYPFFTINRDKSFWGTHLLRESCGVFAYKGMDITVPKVDGYPFDRKGVAGITTLQHQLYSMRDSDFAIRLSHRIVNSRVLSLPNWPYNVNGKCAFHDESVAFDAEPPTRWNSDLCQKQVKVTVSKQAYREFPLYDSPNASGARGNPPPASVWLNAALGGMITGTERKQGAVVRFPLDGKTTTTRRYCSLDYSSTSIKHTSDSVSRNLQRDAGPSLDETLYRAANLAATNGNHLLSAFLLSL